MGNLYSQCLGAVSRYYTSRTFTDPIEMQRLHQAAGNPLPFHSPRPPFAFLTLCNATGSAGGNRRRARFDSSGSERERSGDSVAVDFDLPPLALESRAEHDDDRFPEVSGCSYETLCRRFKEAVHERRDADICRAGIALASRLYLQPGREVAVEEVLRCTLEHCDEGRPYHQYKATRLLAMLCCRLGRRQEAIPLLSLSLDMARMLDDKQNALLLAAALSKCYLDCGDFSLSIPLSLAALQSHDAPDFDWDSLRPPSPRDAQDGGRMV